MQIRGYYQDISNLGIVQWLKCFLYEHRDISSSPRNYVKKI